MMLFRTLLWLSLFLLPTAIHAQAPAASVATHKHTSAGSGVCRPGPWGKLVYHEAYLEAPEELVKYYPLPSTTTCWMIGENVSEEFEGILTKAGFTVALAKQLLSAQRTVRMNGLRCVFPDTAAVINLTPEARAIIYKYLAKWKENEFIANPVFFGRGGVQEWLKGTSLRTELRTLIAKLAWQRGNAFVLSDIEVLMSAAESNQEALQIFRTCTRTRTVMLQLEIDRTTSSETLKSYWSIGQNRKQVVPFIESMKDASATGSVRCDVCHLLSPFVRKLLYTYPDLSLAKNGRFPDCHWTSLNFLNYAPRDFYLNTKLAADTVLKDYHKVNPPYQFGDVVIFLNNGDATHSCAYIADDIVYTKNGDNVVNPWMLAHLDEVKDVYQIDDSVVVQGFRRNDLVSEVPAAASTSK
jgi:hypothetical protein